MDQKGAFWWHQKAPFWSPFWSDFLGSKNESCQPELQIGMEIELLKAHLAVSSVSAIDPNRGRNATFLVRNLPFWWPERSFLAILVTFLVSNCPGVAVELAEKILTTAFPTNTKLSHTLTLIEVNGVVPAVKTTRKVDLSAISFPASLQTQPHFAS